MLLVVYVNHINVVVNLGCFCKGFNAVGSLRKPY